MIIPSIAHYDKLGKAAAKRRRPQAYRTERQPAPAQQFMVYLVRFDGSPLIKVGHSRNIVGRIKSYEGEMGQTARCVLQLLVSSHEGSLELERHAIAYCAARFKRHKREWFVVADSEVPRIASGIKVDSPVPVIEVRGAPGADDPESSVALQFSHEVQNLAGRRIRGGRK